MSIFYFIDEIKFVKLLITVSFSGVFKIYLFESDGNKIKFLNSAIISLACCGVNVFFKIHIRGLKMLKNISKVLFFLIISYSMTELAYADNVRKVFCGTDEKPEDIRARGGFIPRGGDPAHPERNPVNINLWTHTHSATSADRLNSGYVSTTSVQNVAVRWVMDHLNENGYLPHQCHTKLCRCEWHFKGLLAVSTRIRICRFRDYLLATNYWLAENNKWRSGFSGEESGLSAQYLSPSSCWRNTTSTRRFILHGRYNRGLTLPTASYGTMSDNLATQKRARSSSELIGLKQARKK
jgi:hypothetical protein